jgi:hypothetical protein
MFSDKLTKTTCTKIISKKCSNWKAMFWIVLSMKKVVFFFIAISRKKAWFIRGKEAAESIKNVYVICPI